MSFSLEIIDLILPINLGVEKEERENPQEVNFYFKITFDKMPVACVSDNIHDAICYDNLILEVKKFLSEKNFKLIENLAYEVHQRLKQQFSGTVILVKVTKQPKIKDFSGICQFSIES